MLIVLAAIYALIRTASLTQVRCGACNGSGSNGVQCTACGGQGMTGPKGHQIVCGTCGGRGSGACGTCNGSGKVETSSN
jgi:hypothetical protein